MVLGRARTAWSTGCGASTESWNTDKTTYTEIGTLNGSLLLGVAPRSCQLTGQSICSHPGTFEYRVLCNRHRKQKDRTLSSPTPLCSTHHVGVLQREFSPSPGLFLGDRSARCPSLQESPGCPGHIPPYLTLLKRAPPPQAFTEVSSNTAHVCASFRPRLRSVLGFPNLLGHFSDRKPVYQAATRTATCRLLSQPTTSNMLYAVSSETELKPQTFLCPLLQDLIKPVEGPSISGWTRPDRVLSIKYSNTVTGNTQGGEWPMRGEFHTKTCMENRRQHTWKAILCSRIRTLSWYPYYPKWFIQSMQSLHKILIASFRNTTIEFV